MDLLDGPWSPLCRLVLRYVRSCGALGRGRCQVRCTRAARWARRRGRGARRRRSPSRARSCRGRSGTGPSPPTRSSSGPRCCVRRWISCRASGLDTIACSIASRLSALGALADQEALHLDGKDDGDDPEQDADAQRADAVPHRVAGDLRDDHRGECDDEADEGAGVLEEHHRELGLLRPADVAAPSGCCRARGSPRSSRCGTRTPRARSPRAGCRSPIRCSRARAGGGSSRCPRRGRTASRARTARARRRRPRSSAHARNRTGARRSALAGAAGAEQQQSLVPGVGEASGCSRRASTRSREHEADELGDRDAEVREERRDDCSLASAGRLSSRSYPRTITGPGNGEERHRWQRCSRVRMRSRTRWAPTSATATGWWSTRTASTASRTPPVTTSGSTSIPRRRRPARSARRSRTAT